jgi:2-methylcitrate dehydratase PrpD
MGHGTEVSPLMREFSGYIAGALKRKLPDAVAARARIHLVDTFAAMISGTRLVPGKSALKYAKTLGGNREAGIMGTRIVTSAQYAALINGICAHADETDDLHPPTRGHPGACIVPATLAMSERQEVNGVTMLRAMVLGYDIGARTVLALKQAAVARTGFHPSSKGGVMAASALAGALLKLNADQIRHVLSFGAEQAAGLLIMHAASQHTEKAYVVGGMPAQHGIEAALMVASGMTGCDDVLMAEGNLLSCFSSEAEPEALVRGLGVTYEIMRGCIKYWSAGGPIQGPLHLLNDLMREHRFKADEVEKLTVLMPPKSLEIVDNRDMPDICVQHILAVMLLDGNVTFKSTHDFARMKDPKVVKLRKDVIVAKGDPVYADPERRWNGAMEIVLRDGRRHSLQTMAAKGVWDNPLTPEEAEKKALDLMAPVLGRPRSRKLIAALLNIEKLKNVRDLRKLYTV